MKFWKIVSVVTSIILSTSVNASVVRMETTLGSIDIELYDNEAPVTVANFMNYINDGDYNNTFFHRSIPGFILQGGGYSFQNTTGVSAVPTDAPIVNEFDLSRSNVRGTLAMAKLPGDPDSATSQWYFNLADNSANLDFQNGGFTVFGRVIGNGMDVIDAIVALDTVNMGGTFTDLPVINYLPGSIPYEENLVKVNSISSVPVPAAAWLFGSGLIGLIGIFFNIRSHA